MKLAVIDDHGNVVDTYEDVTADDATSPVFSPEILNWLRRTLRNASRQEGGGA